MLSQQACQSAGAGAGCSSAAGAAVSVGSVSPAAVLLVPALVLLLLLLLLLLFYCYNTPLQAPRGHSCLTLTAEHGPWTQQLQQQCIKLQQAKKV
jgi:hypothetical protein